MESTAQCCRPQASTSSRQGLSLYCSNCMGTGGNAKSPLPPVSKVRSTRCTKLHDLLLCTQRKPNAEQVMAFVVKHPMSTRCMDRFGRIPLFWAIKHGHTENLIKNLYKAAPPDLLFLPDVYGKTCLELLFSPRHRNVSLLRWFFDQDPSLAVSRAPLSTSMPLVQRISIRWSLSQNLDAVDLDSLSATILAAHRHSCCRCTLAGSTPLLHMAMDLRLPSIVLQKILSLFPDELEPCSLSSAFHPLHVFLSHYNPHEDKLAIPFLLQMLRLYPRAAQEAFESPNNGKEMWPLHAAIRSGFATCVNFEAIDGLIAAAPWVLHQAEGGTNLLPFQLAATVECSWHETRQVDTIYRLLRSQPSVLHE